MKISQEAVTDVLVIKSYGDGFLLVQPPQQLPQKITQNCIITPDGLVLELDFDAIVETADNVQLEHIQLLQPDVIILVNEAGITPETQRLAANFAEIGIAMETMLLGPACRTYNLLLTEGRKPVLLARF